ncbi:hypothetical protein Y032_0053g2393 [Ancylostoma ceylanicum]|uniref:Uncharacterized protein n=1 Tax=Ancylostoma ceylanicum TaxID=53326 RepID=A0A016U7R4_9BILA|nr:hypothetical protein Y032_0053g2393 [Ancylostoma ceylanicum]
MASCGTRSKGFSRSRKAMCSGFCFSPCFRSAGVPHGSHPSSRSSLRNHNLNPAYPGSIPVRNPLICS